MKKLLSLSMFVMFSMMAFSQTTDLIISEYAEGLGGNKKYIEIYNGTGSDIDMSNYQLWKSVNANPWSGSVQLSGIIANGATYVIANNVTDTPGADLYDTYLSFNGDDAMAIAKDPGSGTYAPIDIVGEDAIDPGSGWTVAGVTNATQDAILIRKATVCSPTTNWVLSAGTDATDSQWIIAVDPFTNSAEATDLGMHTNSCVATCDSYASISLTECTSYTSPSGLYTWTMNGLYNDTIPNTALCDSIITFDLTIATVYNETAALTICSGTSYTFGTQTLTAQGQYTELFTSMDACDSTVILDLTVVASYTETATAEICDGDTYTFGSQSLTLAGPYSELFTSSTGCDSTVNLTLTLLAPTSSSLTEVVCGSYTAPDAMVYTATGLYTAVIPNTAGCDSTISIDLTVNMPSANTITDAACGSYTANAMTYTTSGTYTQTTMNAAGCDSVITFVLDITPTPAAPGVSGDEMYCDGDVINDMTATGSAFDSLIISGVADATLPGGLPKCIEFYAIYDIADLSAYGFGSANNGGGTDGEEFTFPVMALAAGSTYKVATDSVNYFTFFGEYPNTTVASAANVNGDDAIELFHNGVVIDVFGDINMDGTGEAWEYLDSWTYRNNNSLPNGGVFNIAEWSFGGVDILDGATDNATSANPFPLGTFMSTTPTSEINWFSDAALTMNVGTGMTLTPSGTPGAVTYYVTETLIGGSTCDGTASMITITVNALPMLTFAPTSTACVYNAAFTLAATPAGGTFSGTGVSGSDFDPATAGVGVHTITYDYTDANTCSASITADITVDACASIDENNVNNVAIYPNPATDVITLTFEADQALVTIYSVQGQIMNVNTIHSSEMINVSNLEAGTYIVKVVANNKTYTQRVIIK